MTAVLVSLCGGDNEAQTTMLRGLGLLVYPLDVPTGPGATLSKTLAYLREEVTKLKAQHPTLMCHVLGRAMGGYLAKVLFDEGLFTRAAYIAPFFDPMVRAVLVTTARGEESAQYFQGQIVPETSRWLHTHELLLLADERDDNVPLECFTEEQRVAARYFETPRTHAEMVKLVNGDLRACLSSFLN